MVRDQNRALRSVFERERLNVVVGNSNPTMGN
jgi:hypothetical protein